MGYRVFVIIYLELLFLLSIHFILLSKYRKSELRELTVFWYQVCFPFPTQIHQKTV